MTDDATAETTGEPTAGEPIDAHPEPVVVGVYTDAGEAEVTKAHLAANGIEGYIVDQVEGGTVPIEGEWGVAVAVAAQDAEIARAVLAGDDQPDSTLS